MASSYNERVKRYGSQMNNEENNPCFKEHNMSLKCLNDNSYDPDLCQEFFENYNNCKYFWNSVKKHRRINGITPALPPLSERAEIKERYLKTGKI